MTTWIKHGYDTLTTRPNRDAQYYLARHLRRRGLVGEGGGRLARFGKIARYKAVTPRDVVEGRLDRVFVAEYQHYVWRVRPRCAYCGVELTRNTITRDHVVPRAAGGQGGDNLVPACAPCNRAKGCRSLLSFLLTRQQKRRGALDGSHVLADRDAQAVIDDHSGAVPARKASLIQRPPSTRAYDRLIELG